jgi:hypothetical protein
VIDGFLPGAWMPGTGPKDQAKADALAALRLPGVALLRPLDPIEELRQREAIEILSEDPAPSAQRRNWGFERGWRDGGSAAWSAQHH